MPTRLIVESIHWGKVELNDETTFPKDGQWVIMKREFGNEWAVVKKKDMSLVPVWENASGKNVQIKQNDLWMEIPIPPKFK